MRQSELEQAKVPGLMLERLLDEGCEVGAHSASPE
jgi:hypothetical protein